MHAASIEEQIRRRAEHFVVQTHLTVDYYRVRLKLAYPLPVKDIHRAALPMRRFAPSDYPWATWMSWALEERIGCLGWAAEWFGDEQARAAAARDLEALAAWPRYDQYDKPDLSLGHAARTLWAAHAQWTWPDAALRKHIEAAFARILERTLPLSEKIHGAFKRKEDILAQAEPHKALHNIPLIGTVGAALAAHALRHPAAEGLDARLTALLGALLDLREKGLTEAVAYDGYILTFAADWLAVLDEAARKPLLNHPRLRDYFEESCLLAAPGEAVEVPELSDVEPVQMPFHISAQAKLQALQPDPQRAWYLSRCNPERLRADALAALHVLAQKKIQAAPPPSGALDAHYALVLRSGYEREDLAVAIAASNSPMGHIHNDYGSIVLGTHGRWIISDPGYQQYLETREREFTVGVESHNAPVINGLAQSLKAGKRAALQDEGGGRLRAELDLSGCYAPELKATVRRTVWLLGREAAVVLDRVEAGKLETLRYHWHGHPAAAWWVEDGAARLYFEDLPDTQVFVASPNVKLEESQLQRLPGSRGHLTLRAEIPASLFQNANSATVWWVFTVGKQSLPIRADGINIQVGQWYCKG